MGVNKWSQQFLPVLLLIVGGCTALEVDQESKRGLAGYLQRAGATKDSAKHADEADKISPVVSAKADAAQPVSIKGTGRFVGPPLVAPNKGSQGGGDNVTLNLASVPIAHAAKVVLGDMLGVRYTIDPSIKGDVTLQTPHPVSKAAVVELLQASLKASGAVIINAGSGYRIVPADQAMAGAPIRVDEGRSEGIGWHVQVVQLKYVTASEMQRILEPISPRGGMVRADDGRNILSVSGNTQEIAGMLEAISIFDVDTMKGMSFSLVPVRSSQPSAIAEELRTVFASSGGGPMAGMVRFLPNNRLRAVLVITPQHDYLASAEDWIRKLDARAEGTERQFYTYAVQNRRAQDLVNVLRSLFSPDGDSQPARHVAPPHAEALVQTTPESNLIDRGGLSSTMASNKFSGRQSGSLASKNAPQPAATVAFDDASGAPRLKIAADPAKNALLIEATPADHRKLMRVITSLDVMPTQVVIEATIAEISLNDDLKMGVRWFFKNKNDSHTFTDAASGALGSVFPGFSYAMTASNLGVTLNALNKITDVKVISSPSLTVMDNSTAILQIGDQVPITTQSAVGVLGVGAPVVNSVSYRDTGVILAITPRINASGRVLLEIEQEVSTVASTTTSNIDSPTIRQRRIKTNVFVKNGEALALGGMIQASNNTTRGQVPLLGDLPLVGNAFRTRDNERGKTELIVIITPHVIRNFEDARQITEEYRRELAFEARHQDKASAKLGKTLRRILE